MASVEVLEAREQWPDLKPTQRAFLTAYAECGYRSKAAAAVGLERQTHYDWMRHSSNCPDAQCNRCYACAFLRVKETTVDQMEDHLFDRAINGNTAWDMTAAIFALKSNRRETYGDHVDINAKSISVNLTGDIAALSDADRVSLLQLAVAEQTRLLEAPAETVTPDDQV